MGYFFRWLISGWWPLSYRRGEVKPNGHISGGPVRWHKTEADFESETTFGPVGVPKRG